MLRSNSLRQLTAAESEAVQPLLDRIAALRAVPAGGLAAALEALHRDTPRLRAEARLQVPDIADVWEQVFAVALVDGLSQAPALPAGEAPLRNRNGHHDPANGRFASGGGGGGSWSATAAADRGHAAMERVLAEQRDVMGAMDRPELGPIDFRWGNERGGIAHIVGKHGASAARTLPKVIAHGHLIHQPGTRVEIEHMGHRVILDSTFGGQSSDHWVVTAFRKGGSR